MSVEIRLTKGRVALVDDIDADLASVKWHAHQTQYTCYVRCAYRGPDGKRVRRALHQMVAERMGIGTPDHINRDGLDNRRSNLRPGTHNQANRRMQRTNTSGYRGVVFDPSRNRRKQWAAMIRVGKKLMHLGYYFDKADAARAYDAAAVEHFGEFANLNFATPPTPAKEGP